MFVVTASLVGPELRERREGAGMTQAELGSLVGVSGSAVGQWEQGRTRPAWKQVQRLADVFGVTVVSPVNDPNEWGQRLDALQHDLELQAEVLDRIADLGDLVSRRLEEIHRAVVRGGDRQPNAAGERPG